MAGQSETTSNGRTFPQILESFRSSALSFQHPADFITLLGYSVNLFAAIRICNESGAYRILSASESPLTAAQISRQLEDVPDPVTETEARLADREEYIDRMLRAVAALNLIDETAPHTYTANALTRTLAEPGFHEGIKELFDAALGPHSTLSHMTFWAKEEKYIAPTSGTDGPYQRARGIVGTNTFTHWVEREPHMLSNLSALMKVIQRNRLNWSKWFPGEVLFSAGEGGNGVFMVDVGGGLGHDLMGLANRYPERKMRLVVEDLPSVIAETKEEKLDPRIELVEHDFFTEQPIRGAKIVSLASKLGTCGRELTRAVLHAQDHARLAGRRLRDHPHPSPRCNGVR